MAQENSFDIMSEVNLQFIDDTVNVAVKEIQNRFDLKGVDCSITFGRGDKTVTFAAPAEFNLKQIKEIFFTKLAKKDISVKSLQSKGLDKSSNGSVKEVFNLVCGIDKEVAKDIVKDIKAGGHKVQAAIQDDKVRVSGKDKDVLQAVIGMLRQKEYPIPLQFGNYR